MFTFFRKDYNIFSSVHELEETVGDPTATILGIGSVDFGDLVRQFFRARKHHLVAAIHFKKLEISKAGRHSGMEVSRRQRLILAAVDKASRNGEGVNRRSSNLSKFT